MKSKREESLKKIEGETFYTSPPYNYRPSIAEYLTDMNVTKKGFIADIMHLDYKGNLKIKSIKEDSFHINLVDDKDLNLSEIFIWNYLKSIEKDKEILLYFNKIPKSVLSEFSALVRIKTSQKFKPKSLNFNQEAENIKINNYKRSLFAGRIFVGIILSIGFLSFIAIIAGLTKLSKQPSDIKFFFKKFVWKYFTTSLFYFIFFLIFFAILLAETGIEPPLIILPLLLFIGVPLVFLFYNYSKISYDYISWLFESEEASEHRNNWFKFKSFVINNSAIKDKPFGHYKLWGPFYYYTLAVDGIRKKI